MKLVIDKPMEVIIMVHPWLRNAACSLTIYTANHNLCGRLR